MAGETKRRKRREPMIERGLQWRHEGGCPFNDGGACACEPFYRVAIKMSGKLHRSAWTRSRREAEYELAVAIAERKGGRQAPSWTTNAPVVLPTVAEAAAEYEAAMRSGDASPKGRERHYAPGTIARAAGLLRTWITPGLADRQAADVTRQDALRIIDSVRSALGASSTRNAKSVAGAMWAWMIARGAYGVTENPWRGQPRPCGRGEAPRAPRRHLAGSGEAG